MKKVFHLRNIFALLLTAIVLHTVSVREIHYLFAQHAAEEHCENHLHSAEDHGHCAVCKFDVSAFTDTVITIEISNEPYFGEAPAINYLSPLLSFAVSTCFLRGPPALA